MKVLVVDDEMPARARLCALLQDLGGYQVCGEAANGREALQLSEAEQPDVLLLDIRMPGMDGLEAARHLQLWTTCSSRCARNALRMPCVMRSD